tara:strand:+ start:53 stop:292 length:240 start_codon:yes stop_codon:yes gene_type:complete
MEHTVCNVLPKIPDPSVRPEQHRTREYVKIIVHLTEFVFWKEIVTHAWSFNVQVAPPKIKANANPHAMEHARLQLLSTE